MKDLIFSIGVIAPLFFMIMLGYALSQLKLLEKDFIKKTNKLCFRVFLPVLLFHNIYQTDRGTVLNMRLLGVTLVGILSVILVTSLMIVYTIKAQERKGVLIQAIFRSNFILFGIPMVHNIFGDEGTGAAAMLIAIVIPTFNFAAVYILELFTKAKKTSMVEVGKAILRNPLIIASVLAILVSCLGIRFPVAVERTLKDVGGIATPLSLMMLGAQFEIKGAKKNRKYILIGVVGRLLIVPALVLPLLMQMSFNPYEMVALLAVFASPTAVNSFIMAQEAGADSELAGQIVVIGTALAPFTLCLFIYLYRVLHII